MATVATSTAPVERREPPVSPRGAPPIRWRRPTFGEFVEQIEHEFGSTPDLASLHAVGLGPGDPLEPGDIRLLCSEIGVPPEDFGVEP